MILWIANPSTGNDLTVATLVEEVNAVLMRSGEPWTEPGLIGGEYRLDRGLLHLRFPGNVMVYVEAPARFEIASEQRLELLGGRVSASVPPEGIGFTVETSEARIVDDGTEFSVEAESGASEVHVFDGLVRVHSRQGKSAEADAIDLRTAEAVRIENSPQSPVMIELATERFIRDFEDGSLPLAIWRHVIMTADGDQLRIYEDGQLVASTRCKVMTTSDSTSVWFGTGADGSGLWNGRIDELALFDKALSDKDIADLHQAALEEMARSE